MLKLRLNLNQHHYIKIVLTDTGKAFEPDKVPAYVPCTHETDISI